MLRGRVGPGPGMGAPSRARSARPSRGGTDRRGEDGKLHPAGRPLLKRVRATATGASAQSPLSLSSPSQQWVWARKESPHCGKVRGGRFGTRVQGGGRGGNSSCPLSPHRFAFAVEIMEWLKPSRDLGQESNCPPPTSPLPNPTSGEESDAKSSKLL